MEPMDFKRLSVLIPVHNEEGTLQEIVERVGRLDLGLEIEVVLVDDCSSDKSLEVCRAIEKSPPEGIGKVVVCHHEENQGKGAALRTGIEELTGEVTIIQDADLEYDPKDIPNVLEPILDGRAEAVFGSRFLGGGPSRVLYFWHYVANKLLTTFSNMMTNYNLTDMETGYKAYRTHVMKEFEIRCNRFGVEPEMTAKLARKKRILYEVPISYSGRTYDEGKHIGWKDGIAALWWIFRFRFFR
jgi:glycosyltransferase involved in cell wall biosynthesis